jgi:prepilin-type N-terminal cleavage/methylation domain-containing protein
MLARIRKAQEEREGGFTLIELLVVIIIIGILAAIAIPVFLNQRKKAVDASIKSDLRTVANEMETYFTDFQTYNDVAAVSGTMTIGNDTVKLSSGNIVSVDVNTAKTAYCILGENPASSGGTSTDKFVVYVSDDGGLQPNLAAGCPTGF